MIEKTSAFFEGCGKEGPIQCIFLCEFHPTAGPKITCQVPENYISKDTFDTISVYTIPKAELQRSTITVTLGQGIKILGFPVGINDKKYARNAFYFNLCFVCDSWARTVHYEPVVKKLTDFLVGMELGTSFLSSQDREKTNERLKQMLGKVMKDLNTYRMCNLTEGKTCFSDEQWDLTTQQVLPYIDGFNHVSKIAVEADCENNLVKSCIQNLIYYGVATLIPIFQYSNIYATTPKLRQLTVDKILRDECLEFVWKCARQPPAFRDVFVFYSSMNRGTTVRDLCVRLNPHIKRINERRLVQFGVLRGIITRIHRYIIYTGSKEAYPINPLYRYMNGSYSDDEICCATGTSAVQLEELLESDHKLLTIWK